MELAPESSSVECSRVAACGVCSILSPFVEFHVTVCPIVAAYDKAVGTTIACIVKRTCNIAVVIYTQVHVESIALDVSFQAR